MYDLDRGGSEPSVHTHSQGLPACICICMYDSGSNNIQVCIREHIYLPVHLSYIKMLKAVRMTVLNRL